MNKKALVTGATGFVGSNLVRGLLNDGWSVDIIVRPSSDLQIISDISQKVHIHEFNSEIDTLIEVMTKSNPNVVFHVASLFLSDHRADQIDDLIQSNVLFGVQLLEAMSKTGIRYLVNTSTSWEHYENKDYSPVNLYAATKRAFQDLLQYYVEAKGIKAITLKLFDTYGPNDSRPKLLNLLMKIAETGETLSMSPGEQEVDFVHIDDVIKAYLVAAQRLFEGKVTQHESYSVSSGQPLPLKKLVQIYAETSKKHIAVTWGGRSYRCREVMATWNHGNKLIQWEPKVTLENGFIALNKNDHSCG